MVIDTIINYKTVKSLNVENRIIKAYSDSLDSAV